VPSLPSFAELAASPDPTLDVLALALAAEFRAVDGGVALAELDALAAELSRAAGQTDRTPDALARACAQTLGVTHGFAGETAQYDHPDNSMLDLVLMRRRGLPILLSVIYVEVARRAGIELGAVGLPGHFVVAHFGTDPPLLLDPFAGGEPISPNVPAELVRPWGAHEVAMRMLNNLVASYRRRGDLGAAIHAAGMRMALAAEPSERDMLQSELRAMQARLN
jgi:regulator of sirC expression with transglutaminase-like and TPR domain